MIKMMISRSILRPAWRVFAAQAMCWTTRYQDTVRRWWEIYPTVFPVPLSASCFDKNHPCSGLQLRIILMELGDENSSACFKGLGRWCFDSHVKSLFPKCLWHHLPVMLNRQVDSNCHPDNLHILVRQRRNEDVMKPYLYHICLI